MPCPHILGQPGPPSDSQTQRPGCCSCLTHHQASVKKSQAFSQPLFYKNNHLCRGAERQGGAFSQGRTVSCGRGDASSAFLGCLLLSCDFGGGEATVREVLGLAKSLPLPDSGVSRLSPGIVHAWLSPLKSLWAETARLLPAPGLRLGLGSSQSGKQAAGLPYFHRGREALGLGIRALGVFFAQAGFPECACHHFPGDCDHPCLSLGLSFRLFKLRSLAG